MKPAVRERLERLAERHAALAEALARPETASDPERLRETATEHARLAPVAEAWARYRAAEARAAEARALLAEERDAELRALAQEELAAAEAELARLEDELQRLLLPRDPNDERNIYLEIRAGTGGDEAALFAGDLFRMYGRYAERKGWKVEVLSAHPGEHGGYKEIIARVVGRGAWSRLKYESGVHRVQRVPVTESQGRIHTSACTVAVLPELPEVERVVIDPAELRIDTFRASGAGGQHVNKTESAVRITHLPTGIVVECQDERSQHKNKARAMALLAAKLLARERERRQSEQAAERRRLVGSGDRSERIRTYNFPQGRVTDHRINLTLYRLEEILDGDLDELIDALAAADQAEQLAALAEA